MGIPSFYRTLCKQFPRLIEHTMGASPEWLCFDFNCAMYTVLRNQSPFDNTAKWEQTLCDEIIAYWLDITQRVGPTRGVFVGCDGAVCAAKRRQQRLRRFKGPWTAAQEARIRGTMRETCNDTWDQNALTPGTEFMTKLGSALSNAGRILQKQTGLQVIVSTTAEPGEGEHKLMTAMRRERPASCTIYGLDADLILLAMLLVHETRADVRLLREAQEFERTGPKQEWRTLSINALVNVMIPSRNVPDFVAAMSLLGNDFIPRSLTQTVRDDGIPKLLSLLEQTLWSRGESLVMRNGAISRVSLLALVSVWAQTEERDLLRAANESRQIATRPAFGIQRATTPRERELCEWNAQPARWSSVGSLAKDGALRENWQRTYYGEWRASAASAEYLSGIAWVWAYYCGRTVCQAWVLDSHLPPLWADVVSTLRASILDAPTEGLKPPVVVWDVPLPDRVHLLAVLPAESVRRLLPVEYHTFLAKHAYWWPTGWSLFDVGRTQLWECEAVLPLIPESVLRRIEL